MAGVAALWAEPWAIEPSYLAALQEAVAAWSEWPDITAEQQAAVTALGTPPSSAGGGVAVIPVMGVLTYRPSILQQIMGATPTQRIMAAIREADAHPQVSTIVLDVDSPGGEVDGIMELADTVRSTTSRTVAVANTLMASAAYWAASAADEIVVSPSARVGSIGIVAEHQDVSRREESEGVTTTVIAAGEGKEDGSPSQPLSDRARDDLQRKVDAYYARFVGDVVSGRNATGRHLTRDTVRTKWKAGVYLADEAVSLGMADRVGTLESVLAKLTSRRSTWAESAQRRRRRAAVG